MPPPLRRRSTASRAPPVPWASKSSRRPPQRAQKRRSPGTPVLKFRSESQDHGTPTQRCAVEDKEQHGKARKENRSGAQASRSAPVRSAGGSASSAEGEVRQVRRDRRLDP